jgi:hypothetical protein
MINLLSFRELFYFKMIRLKGFFFLYICLITADIRSLRKVKHFKFVLLVLNIRTRLIITKNCCLT